MASPLPAGAPAVWEPPVLGEITTAFGGCNFAECPHLAVDIAAAELSAVFAPADGRVVAINQGFVWRDGYGDHVIIDHGAGVRSLLGHLSDHPPGAGGVVPMPGVPSVLAIPVPLGLPVRRGQTIRYVGRTGKTSGPHVHWLVTINGVPIDPVELVPDSLKRQPGALTPTPIPGADQPGGSMLPSPFRPEPGQALLPGQATVPIVRDLDPRLLVLAGLGLAGALLAAGRTRP